MDILASDERQVMAHLNATDSLPTPDRTVVEMFEVQAEIEPDRVALRQGQREISYATLRQESEALASTLIEHGLEPGDRVAIVGRRSALAVVSILAVLRARAAFVPIGTGASDRVVPAGSG